MIVGKEYKDKFLPHWEKWKRVTFRGYNYGGIIANELSHLHHIDGNGKKYNLAGELKFLLKSLFYKNLNLPVSVTNISGNASCSNTIGFVMDDDNRGDYLKQCEFVLNQLNDYKIRVFTVVKDVKLKKRFAFGSSINKLIIVVKVLSNVSVKKSFKSQSLSKNINLLAKCLFYYDVIENIKLNKLLDNVDLLIAFSDMKQYGNIFVQSAKIQGIVTGTLQHGIYIRHKDDQYSQSAINYLNSPADYLLGWGESIVNVFNVDGQTVKKVLLSGSSVKDYQIDDYYTTMDQTRLPSNKFVVLFSRSTLRQSNADMLRISQIVASETGYRFDVLMHPTNKMEHYEFDKCTNLNKIYQDSSLLLKLIDDSDFCICHSTTVYFTSLLKHKACFRYEDKYFIDYGGLNDKFSDEKELLNKITESAHSLENDKKKQVEMLLKHQFGNIEYSYKKSIQTLLNQAVKS
ncbi:hypothetical protein [Mucilaginibacter defluvii]|uniref:CDP-glycerol:poly(Glycerophosphate) glycerophosphotransferase n=1 Tax=Mucilaginibacter defluvii TaxID=1196019 RepID=A0ABP9FIY5_9SPHI